MRLVALPITKKLAAGERLTAKDALALYDWDDLFGLARLADQANRRRHGLKVYFNFNRHLNPSNLCIYSGDCKLCSFAAPVHDLNGYTLSRMEILQLAADMMADGATEIRIVVGIHPVKDYDWYLGIIQDLKAAHPDIHIKAWSAVEIDHFTRLTGKPIESVLREMQEAGVSCLPGGGAKLFREMIGTQSAAGHPWLERWLEIHSTAHELGLPSTATMLFGYGENREDRIAHLARLRDQQDRTGGFLSFVPLAFRSVDAIVAEEPTAIDELRTLAIARLFLDNFANIGTSWRDCASPTSQVDLHFGVNDLQCAVIKDRMRHQPLTSSRGSLSRDELLRLIRKAGRIPVERNAFYEEVRVWH
ncbi:MAG: CofH family radical SAM protein [bacterium]|nr:CofH family radical SAM protein [bacterium]